MEVLAERAYHVLEKIGEGSFGAVYRGEMVGQAGFRKTVALKVLRTEKANNQKVLERLRDEARLMALVRHRAIVNVDALIELEGNWTVVMEFVGGCSLQDAIKVNGPLPATAALEVIAEVADALDAAYSTPRADGTPLGLVHRDVKPANLQITNRGEVKLLDFGIAKADFVGRESNTEGVLLGTLRYMSPERLEGVDGPEGDIYAVGATLVALLMGRSVPRTSPVRSKHRAHLRKVAGGLAGQTPEVRALVLSTLSYGPQERPDAPALVREALRLARSMEGPTFAEWAATAVPATESDRTRMEPDAFVGRVLQETLTTLTSGPTAVEPPQSTTASRGAFAAAAVGTLLLPTLAVCAVGAVGLAAYNGRSGAVVAPVEHAEAPIPTPTAAPIAAPTEAPAVFPEPAVPRPAPAPRPAAAPEPATVADPVAAMGMLTVQGDAHQVILRGPSGTVQPGEVEPGDYDLMVAYEPGGLLVRERSVSVLAGQGTTVSCQVRFQLCKVTP